MIDLPPSSRRTYSDNGDSAVPDRNPNRDHPRHSRGTWVAVAIGGSAVVGAGASMYASNKAAGAAGANAPAPRDLGRELTTIGGSLGGLTASAGDAYAGNAGRYAQTNQNSFNQTMRGGFDPALHEKSAPGFNKQFSDLQAAGELKGWTPEQFALANAGNNQGALAGSYSGGLAGQLRQNYDAANPTQTAYNGQLASDLARLNGQGAPQAAGQYVNPLPGVQTNTAGFAAAQGQTASFNPLQARASTAQVDRARFTGANGGPLLGAMQGDAARNLGQVSGLQGQLQQQASSLLGAGGGLTQGETMDAQQGARAAYADRGRLRGNAGIGAEILGTDQARRARLMQNAQFAQGVDASGQQQLAAGRSYAGAVQGQGQNLSTFNSGQANSLSSFNSGQANDVGKFNAGQRQQNSQFNTGQANQIGSQLATFNAGQANDLARFNYGGLNAMNQDAATRADANARFNYSGAAENNRFNAGQANDLSRFNAGLTASNQNDQWGRSMSLGQLYGTQAINANEFGMRLSQGAPDYTGAVLGYGNDVANTNYNGAASRANSAANNSAALMGAGINSIGQMGNAFASYYGNRPPAPTSPGGPNGGGSSY